jgi:hypothetical protein
MIDRRTFLAMAAPLAGKKTRRASAEDTFLPWEKGPEYYGKWTNGPPADSSYFPIAVWLQDPRNAARYKAIGINLYIGLWKGPTEAQLAQLAAAEMPVLASQNETGLTGENRGLIRAWLMMDEPDNAQSLPEGGYGSCILPAQIAEEAGKMREQDATRPIFLNLGQGVINPAYKGRGSICSRHDEHYPEYIKAVDIVSYDVYPVNGKLPLWYVSAGVRRLREWANYEKPVWNCIETASIRGEPKPTPGQIRSEVWMSIINGSRGIVYFCHQFSPAFSETAPLQDEETSAALTALNRRITALAPVLNQPSVANGVTVESGNAELPIEYMLKRHEDKTYLFAAGARPDVTSEVQFTLRDCGDLEAQVLDESRTVAVVGGVFRDTFTGYEVRIYELPFRPGWAQDGG